MKLQVNAENVYHLSSARKNLHIVPTARKKLTLLLIHENHEKLTQWTNIFDDDYSIQIASDAITALKLILDEKVDLILSSVQLPDISGLDVCKFVKQHITTQHIQMIFVSDHYSEFEEDEALSLGAIDYISSEVQANILFKRVKNHMKLVKRSKELEQVSRTDALTGIANRKCFDEKLKHAWKTAIRGGSSLALIMIDIDHFKLYNDEFGHVKGDECLVAVAKCLANGNYRSEDIVARFGGEEFIILLPFTDLEGASKIAQNIVKSISQLNIPQSQKAHYPQVTVSAGVTAYSPSYNQKTSCSMTELVKRADVKLYQAKQFGRNQFCA